MLISVWILSTAIVCWLQIFFALLIRYYLRYNLLPYNFAVLRYKSLNVYLYFWHCTFSSFFPSHPYRNFLVPSSSSFSSVASSFLFSPLFPLFILVFCSVPRHQSFVGALAGTTSRFEISTARWRRERQADEPLPVSQSVESYLSLFQAPRLAAVESSSRAFALLHYVITTLIVLPLSGERLSISQGHTHEATRLCSQEPPKRSTTDIFLTIGGRKPVWDMSFVFLHHRILLSVPGIVPSPSQIHFFHLIFLFLFLYDHRRLKEGREVEERDWIVWKYQRLQLLAATWKKRVWRVWLRLSFVACVGAAFLRGNLMANNYTL